MKLTYDLHIHSCLSPCGEDEMTPNNIVNMAQVLGLDLIAVSDHNAAGNVRVCVEVGRMAGLTVVPAIELETSEEVHILLLFPDCDRAEACAVEIAEKRLPVKNRVDVYGNQYLMDASDRIVGVEDNLLIVATTIGVYDAGELASRYGGIAIPAHIDKPSNGLLQMLGTLDDGMGFTAVELSPNAPPELEAQLRARGYNVLYDSDAHFLERFAEHEPHTIDLNEKSAQALIDALRVKQSPNFNR